MIANPKLSKLPPPRHGHERMFGGCMYFVPKRRAQSQHGFHSTADDTQHLTCVQAKFRIACQRVFDTFPASSKVLDGYPSARIGIHHLCFANDAFRKSVFAEPQDLIEYLIREALLVAAPAHAVDQPALEGLETSLAFPGRHGAP